MSKHDQVQFNSKYRTDSLNAQRRNTVAFRTQNSVKMKYSSPYNTLSFVVRA